MKKLTALLLAIFCISTLAMATTMEVKGGASQPKRKIVVKKVKRVKKVMLKGTVVPVAPVVPAPKK